MKDKKYNLKESETRLLQFTRMQHDLVFSALISTIANDRMSYKITENSKFALNDELTEVVISEVDPQKDK